MEHRPERGDLYQHFKGGFYVVHAVAFDCTNDLTYEEYVVYRRATKDNHNLLIRKLSEFVSKVDANKYPEYKNLDRFKFLGNVIDH